MLREYYYKFEINMNKLKLFFLLVIITSNAGCNFFARDNSVTISIEEDQKSVETVVGITKKPMQNDDKKNQEQYPNNFLIPIKDGCITDRPELLPGSPRTYRNGIHEGVDFYDGFSCTKIDFGTEIFAVDNGVVFRADIGYIDPPDALIELVNDPNIKKYTSEQKLDIYRGRQIWIEHKNGVVTRYAHLSGIAEDVKLGSKVIKGQLIGFVGDSGTPESITAPGTENHLHLEIRQGKDYLGSEIQIDKMHQYYLSIFDQE
tara:strand:+ start:3218 stop:3997 length:780 start_codon:yes stop_codon:yes gene_type:complete